ncbi:unnamed protein product [Spirodela intermedia]|uniref:Uncharacterized protein n=1 Tax=Spirodela intermedia TaxID=51605 RepID=A0A7I8JRG7_SPIIN|nr:unnamed protein product [Spirodela intermedia]CAA6672719.1 unnamed protein product [Spirodela intermedia]
MLKKMSGASQKHAGDRPMTTPASERTCFSDFDRRSSSASLFGRPGLFIGFGKGMVDSDSSGSPKSPLDYRIFSGFGGHRVRSPRSPRAGGPRKIWNGDKVGLSLINEGECRSSGGVVGSSESRSILFVSQMRVGISNPKTSIDHHPLAEGSACSSKSLPKNYAISFHGRIESPDLRSDPSKKKGSELPVSRSVSPPSVGAGGSIIASGSLPITSGFTDSLSASEIERSEDYTRIISRGPNPKTTHIFGDCVLEALSAGDAPDFAGNDGRAEEEGREGEKAFCSCACRSREIGTEEEEPANDRPGSPPPSRPEEIVPTGGDIAT